ncbi:DUF1304 domain-containing protein [Rhodococcus sp. NPDC058521]|uniref:DUF1304 domain-containing protein n=1 Tax=Rhodococcus sp. NPDC058521 TaxID=3346536 RepID=UPI0036531CE7
MPLISLVLATFTALLHVGIFVLESVLWTRPDVWQQFGVKSQADAEVARPLAFNQGFYNLFLALGLFGGLILGGSAGHGVVVFCCLAIVGAALVLATTGKAYLRPAFIQGILPALALLAAVIW